MLTAKSNYNLYTQIMPFPQSTLRKVPPPSAAQTDTLFYLLDAFFFLNLRKDARQTKLRGFSCTLRNTLVHFLAESYIQGL